MPLRTRIRRAFARGSSDEDGALSKTASKSSKSSKRDSNVYQPGEKMPPMKYRRPVAPEHKEKLESFSWAKAWRRKSAQSIYSPMGSRMPSRKSSLTTIGRRSIGGRKGSSRGTDGLGVDSGFGGSVDESRPERVREGSDEEGDVMNVGLSRPPTNDHRKSSSVDRRSQSLHRRSQSIKSGSSHPARHSLSTSKVESPFTPEELELALKRSHLEAPKEES
ncbi:hypothetical protein K505DRAFT_216850, partial [Melanomma pulvis-pyrius CBS 109.77]